MGKIKLTKKDILEIEKERIKSLFKEGYNVTEILEFVDLTYEFVHSYLKKEGLIKKQKRFSLESSDKIIIKLFKEGKTFNEIAFELKRAPAFVASVLKKSNLIKNKYFYGGKEFDGEDRKKQYQKEIALKVIFDHEKGKTLQQLKEDYQISMHSVKRIITRSKTYNR